ncbi:HlyD family secretion protein [Paracoccus onubensis]|uniref:HlyD family secretion protein n=1 Tax=Paracoccus onubensis TaxID=1675788 RepID=A0A418SVH8_9RHOB|nr:HlyD family secretion protein [Paracoccus onubensis]RJE84956.1 HlyD family secretion protein [Paracoccus onubensis]
MASTTDDEVPDDAPQNAAQAPRPKSGKAKRILVILAVMALAVIGYEGWHWFSFGRFHEETDDAYLQASLIILQARETGYISEVTVEPNAPVQKDQVLARIDPDDYRLALENAENSLSSAKSAAVQLRAQIDSGHAAVEQAQAALTAARATNDGAQKAYRRAQELQTTRAGTQATTDAAEATAKSAAAQVQSAKAALAQAKAELVVLKARYDGAELDIKAAETGVKQARRDLSFTEIRAPFTGILTAREIEPGSYVTAGSRIGTLVPVGEIYAEANFKETQIAGIRPGAEVSLQVDAWPEETLHGTVQSLSAGTGQVFSLLPSSNATGNFTKVVQRVPVRIVIDAQDRARLPLRPGMSVIAEIDTRTGRDEPLLPAPHPGSPGKGDMPDSPEISAIDKSGVTVAQHGG